MKFDADAPIYVEFVTIVIQFLVDLTHEIDGSTPMLQSVYVDSLSKSSPNRTIVFSYSKITTDNDISLQENLKKCYFVATSAIRLRDFFVQVSHTIFFNHSALLLLGSTPHRGIGIAYYHRWQQLPQKSRLLKLAMKIWNYHGLHDNCELHTENMEFVIQF